jgi:hypothetical protein
LRIKEQETCLTLQEHDDDDDDDQMMLVVCSVTVSFGSKLWKEQLSASPTRKRE